MNAMVGNATSRCTTRGYVSYHVSCSDSFSYLSFLYSVPSAIMFSMHDFLTNGDLEPFNFNTALEIQGPVEPEPCTTAGTKSRGNWLTLMSPN